ncbi:MAG: hypothetical protein EA416_02020 [Trueperaceae bacterium]|jgi:hypothetical protein|nr:MAG: hypothetical protein EA416_02020 [Trueperaceae bacterium]
MRKLLISLIAIAALGTGGAFAQSGFWAGLSGGYPGAQVHFGVENAFAGLDVRGNLGYAFFAGNVFGFGVDVMYGLDVDTGMTPIDVYVGGGPNFSFGAGNLGLSIDAFVGGEYRLGEIGLPEGGVFLEVGPAIQIVDEFRFGFIGRLGFNYHF